MAQDGRLGMAGTPGQGPNQTAVLTPSEAAWRGLVRELLASCPCPHCQVNRQLDAWLSRADGPGQGVELASQPAPNSDRSQLNANTH
jgi:hypothetical protein